MESEENEVLDQRASVNRSESRSQGNAESEEEEDSKGENGSNSDTMEHDDPVASQPERTNFTRCTDF